MEILDRHSRCRSVLFLFDQKFFETTGVHAHVTQERIVVEAVFRKYVFQPNLVVTFVVPSRFVKLCCKVTKIFSAVRCRGYCIRSGINEFSVGRNRSFGTGP